MLVKLLIFMLVSLSKYAINLVSLQPVPAVVLNTVFLGELVSQNSSHPIGAQFVEPLFNYFTSPPLLTINYLIL